jgi:phage-related protein
LIPLAPGVSELRVKGEDGIFRVVKKIQRTPPLEMELARKRLKELLDA